MRRILFVDDEPKVLDGLRRMLRSMRHEWEMEFAEGGQAALAALAAKPFDVIVTDMRMPGMDGAQLLTEVRERYPHVVRIVLSGHSDKEMIMKSVGTAHQYLSKPCDAECLKETVRRACALRDLLTNATLQLVISQIQSLPSLPDFYFELIDELNSPNASIKRVGEIISKDIGMTAKILQMVNSAFFGLRRRVASPTDAASLLGLETIRALVLSIQIFSHYDGIHSVASTLGGIWSHSMAVAKLAKLIARLEGQEQRIAEEAFASGLLHDVGRLILAATFPKEYERALAISNLERIGLNEAERQVLGAAHSEVGAYLLGIWGLPDSIVEAVAFHHEPGQSTSHRFTPLTAIHAADFIAQEMGYVGSRNSRPAALDQEYLKKLGLAERLPIWFEAAGSLDGEDGEN
ncbi:response regulator [Pyrinomonas methylaliphatogenes]|uniref:Uncharacterized domain HDIG-containing protein n=1 Tax=Pyrinomonas methylaliphatogenes TaxID=454194 RepID=A0A0B6WVG9_9BACT|nr:response regulator [Pyrinomonas methylaliphatogenes]CDM64095.1 uncharacterized domain HDIG-containing protein [Pyrinomonas methylaliphatogenes]